MFNRNILNASRNAYEIIAGRRSDNFSISLTLKRHVSNAELSTILRPFYFAVHPDLFGQHPEQRHTNEESLKHLSAYIESLQKQRALTSSPQSLNFYIRDTASRDRFKLVKIRLERHLDIKRFIKNILETCSLSTEKIDEIKITKDSANSNRRPASAEEYHARDASIFEEYEVYWQSSQKAKQEKTLEKWILANIKIAHERTEALQGIRDEVEKLEKSIVKNIKLKSIQYDCGWNIEHIRGCLKSLDRISKMHENDMKGLEGRTIVFAQTSGVSLDGHVMLFTGDVQHNWLDFIRNIPKQDAYLQRIPLYEQALSQVLRNIRVARRKFMPKAQVVHYAAHLCKVTTSMLDYLTVHSKYPKSWPEDLANFEIVIESEAGPLMVSPTGQFIAPATCPGSILVDFLTVHMDEAAQKAKEYDTNKHVEKELHENCVRQLKVKQLTKDDSIDPNKMIECLKRLIKTDVQFENCVLHITHYYSVLSDGTVCIPWDWTLA